MKRSNLPNSRSFSRVVSKGIFEDCPDHGCPCCGNPFGPCRKEGFGVGKPSFPASPDKGILGQRIPIREIRPSHGCSFCGTLFWSCSMFFPYFVDFLNPLYRADGFANLDIPPIQKDELHFQICRINWN